MKKYIKLISVIALMIILLSGSNLFITATNEVEPQASEIPSIEQQIRDYAKSINYSNANSDAAWAIAGHGITGRGKKLEVGEDHPLTATLLNAELSIANLVQGCDVAIRSMQQMGDDSVFVDGGAYWGTNTRHYITTIYRSEAYITDDLVYRSDIVSFTGDFNSYDNSLIWIAGSTEIHVTITKSEVTEEQIKYEVVSIFEDRFDFNTDKGSVPREIASLLGSALFKEFDWSATAKFYIVVPNDCNHLSSNQHIQYDAETKNMFSIENNDFIQYDVKKNEHVGISGKMEYYYELERPIILRHDSPWNLEYSVKNPRIFAFSAAQQLNNVHPYLITRGNTHLFFEKHNYWGDTNELNCYGYTFANMFYFSNEYIYTISLENVVNEDGSNMVYVSVYNNDLHKTEVESLPIDDHYLLEDGVLYLQNDKSDGLSGLDFRFSYIGNYNYCFDTEYFELKVWENGKDGESDQYFSETKVSPSCTKNGYTTHECSMCGYTYTDNYVSKTGHNFGEWTVKRISDCTTEGERQRSCSKCNYTETENIPAKGHVYEEYSAKEPTCTETGWNEYQVCTVCNFSTIEEIPSFGHDWSVEEITPPDCTEYGVEKYTCLTCGYTELRNSAALGHKLVIYKHKAPSCISFGWDEYEVCSKCNYTTYVELPALGHTLTWYEEMKPTCTEKGYAAYEACSACSYSTYKELPATGHSYDAVVTDPTCTEQGYTTYTCRCGDRYTGEYIEASHNLGKWYIVAQSTCTDLGIEQRDCAECDYFETKEIEALGHKKVVHAAKSENCVDAGWNAYETCIRCDYTTYVEIPATGHQYETIVIPPTCIEQGYAIYICYCGSICVDNYVEALGHSLGNWYTTVESTCVETGTEQRDCDGCDYYETRKASALGHSYETVVTAPTCTEKGYTTYACHCGDTYVDNYVNALGHNFGEWYVTIEPTCVQMGTEKRDCDICDYYEIREFSALGHNYEFVVTSPTCTEQGYTTYACHCGDSYVDNYVNALGHNFGNWYITSEPTCVESGTEQRDCTHCEHREERTSEALDHDLTYYDEMPATCTESGHLAYEECNRCAHTTYVRILATGHSYENGACTACGEGDPNFIYGDVNGDGSVNMLDSFRLKLIIKEKIKAIEYEVIAADVNADGKINMLDSFELKYRIKSGAWRREAD